MDDLKSFIMPDEYKNNAEVNSYVLKLRAYGFFTEEEISFLVHNTFKLENEYVPEQRPGVFRKPKEVTNETVFFKNLLPYDQKDGKIIVPKQYTKIKGVTLTDAFNIAMVSSNVLYWFLLDTDNKIRLYDILNNNSETKVPNYRNSEYTFVDLLGDLFRVPCPHENQLLMSYLISGIRDDKTLLRKIRNENYHYGYGDYDPNAKRMMEIKYNLNKYLMLLSYTKHGTINIIDEEIPYNCTCPKLSGAPLVLTKRVMENLKH